MDFDDLAPLEMDETYEAEHKQQRESAEEEREGEGEVVVVVLGEEAERPLSASRPPPLPDSLSYSVVDETAKSTISHSDSSETFSHNNNNNNVNSSSSSSTIDKQPPPSSAVVQLEEAHSVDGNLPASSATTQEQQPQHQQEIDTTTTTTDNTTTTTAPPPPPPTHLPFTLFHQREVASHHNSKSHLHSHSQLLVASKQWAESVNSRFHSLKQETIQLQTNNKERMGMPTNRRAHFNKPVFQSLPGTGCPGVKHKMRVSKEFYFTDADLQAVADSDSVLVPIRIDVDVDGFKIKDTFTWNLHEKLIAPELFAQNMCEDLLVPLNIASNAVTSIAKCIRDQVDDYFQHAPAHLKAGDAGRGKLTATKTTSTTATFDEDGDDKTNGLNIPPAAPFPDYPELRIMIKLDIIIGNVSLMDYIDWDLNCPANDPEMFARRMVAEMDLPTESAIAHSIREQAYTYAKSLLLVDHKFDGKPVTEDEELAAALLPPLFIDNNSDVTATTSTVDPQKATTTADPNVRRGDKDALITGPYVEHVNDKSIQELDKELEREARRKRRNTRSRRAIALPERDPIRTLRTIIPVFGKQPDAIVAPRRGATHNMHGGATGGAGVYAEIDSQSDEDDDVDEDGERISSRRKRANIAPGSYADNSSSFATSSSSAAAAAGNNNILTAPLNTVANASYHSPMPNAEQSIALAKHANLRTTLRVDVSLLEWRCSGCNCRQTVPRRLEITSATGLQVACDSCQSKFYSYVANVQQVSDAAFNQNITNSTSSSSELEPIPQWLASELAKYRSKYPADIIEVVRKGGEWRFKCTDCIGKLYSVGPGQTMGNFELHLKNRKHRDAVSKRMWVVPMATGHK